MFVLGGLMKRIVITQPKRFYTFVALCIFILALALTLVFSFVSRESSSAASPVHEKTVLVKAGDTVWHLAETVAEHDGRDVRDIVRDIYRVNNLWSSGIYPGQTLRIPIQ